MAEHCNNSGDMLYSTQFCSRVHLITKSAYTVTLSVTLFVSQAWARENGMGRQSEWTIQWTSKQHSTQHCVYFV